MIIPFFATLYLSLGIALSSFVIGFITGNHSVVDKLWSIVPVMYTWFYWVYALLFTQSFSLVPMRLHVMMFLVTLWGTRLTANFARKGGYAWEAEDYRWAHVRHFFGTHNFLFQLFHISFIALYQHLLLWSMTLPAFAALNSQEAWSSRDTLSSLGFLFFWVIEHIADGQQFFFQTEKYRKLKIGSTSLTADEKRGFLSQGLFAYSRHPNFIAEQAQWVLFATLGPSTINHFSYPGYSYYGALSLICLFQGSTWLTEKITLSRHPLYQKYQQVVPRFIPSLSSILFGPTPFATKEIDDKIN